MTFLTVVFGILYKVDPDPDPDQYLKKKRTPNL